MALASFGYFFGDIVVKSMINSQLQTPLLFHNKFTHFLSIIFILYGNKIQTFGKPNLKLTAKNIRQISTINSTMSSRYYQASSMC